MSGETGLGIVLLLGFLTVLMLAGAAVGAWLLQRRFPGIGGKGYRQPPPRHDKADGDGLWGDEGGGGESTPHKAA
jgi:hypothetical protein